MLRDSLASRLFGTSRQYRVAVVHTSVAVIALTVAMGIVLLPKYFDRSSKVLQTSVIGWQLCESGQTFVTLNKEHRLDQPQRRYLSWHELSTNQAVRFDFPTLQPTSFAVSPRDGKLYMAHEADGSIWRVDGSGSAQQLYLLGRHIKGFSHSLAISCDGCTLISLGNHGLYAWDLDDCRLRWCRFDTDPTAAALLSNERAIVCLRSQHGATDIEEIDLQSGATIQLIKKNVTPVTQLVTSPDRRFVVAACHGSKVLLLERNVDDMSWHGRQIAEQLTGVAAVVPAFSPQSDLLVLGYHNGHGLAILEVERGLTVRELAASLEKPIQGSVFLDDDSLVSWNRDGSVFMWKLTANSSAHQQR